MAIIARKYLTLPTPSGDAGRVTLEVASTTRGYVVLHNGNELALGPYQNKDAALCACDLALGEGLSPEVCIARRLVAKPLHGTLVSITWTRVVYHDGMYTVMHGEQVVAVEPDADTALYVANLELGEGCLSVPKKRFALTAR